MGEPSNADIMHELGALSAKVEGMRAEVDSGADSRRRIHEKLEAQGARLGELNFAIEAQASIQAQTREVLKELADIQQRIATNIQPLLDLRADLPPMVAGWKDLKRTGSRLIWVIGIAGGGIVTFILWFGDVVRQAILHWLGIGPT